MDASVLDPAEFTETARRAAAACAGLPLRAQAVRLAEDGLLGILAAEDAGGLALGLPFAAAVVEAASGGLLAFPLIETILLARALPVQEAASLVAGGRVATIAWAGGTATGVAGHAPFLREAASVLVRSEGGGALVPVDPAALDVVPGLDADVPAAEMRLDTVPNGTVDWAALESDALVLRTAAMLGAAEAAMGLAVEHTTPRKQFGRPLVAFQAVRHALARQKLSVEGIRGSLIRALAEGNAADPYIRRTAFAFAADRAPAVAESALQLHGGMGFTWDIPVHRHLRHIRLWEAEGQAAPNRDAVARSLLDAARGYDWGDAA